MDMRVITFSNTYTSILDLNPAVPATNWSNGWKYHGLHHGILLVYLSETAAQILSARLHNIVVEEGAFVIASIFGIPHQEPPPKVCF